MAAKRATFLSIQDRIQRTSRSGNVTVRVVLRETLAADHFGIIGRSFFRNARKCGIGAVDIEQSKALGVALCPLKVVHQ